MESVPTVMLEAATPSPGPFSAKADHGHDGDYQDEDDDDLFDEEEDMGEEEHTEEEEEREMTLEEKKVCLMFIT